MSKLNKTPLFVVTLILLGLNVFTAGVVSADGVLTPSVPKFTLTIFDSSYDTESTTKINPYTGKTEITEGAHVELRTVEFRIMNEVFAPYTLPDDPNNWTVNYFYNIRWKGHYETDWNNLYLISDGYPTMDYESDYTVVSYECRYSSATGLELEAGSIKTTLPVGAEVDFQLDAMIGYISRQYAGDYGPFSFPYVFTGESSDWSSTQTITVGDNTFATPYPSGSPSNPTPKASQPISMGSILFGLDCIGLASVGLLAVIVVLLIFVVVYLRRRSPKT